MVHLRRSPTRHADHRGRGLSAFPPPSNHANRDSVGPPIRASGRLLPEILHR
jgi:hypothetical protein